jgi:hypothetical protein
MKRSIFGVVVLLSMVLLLLGTVSFADAWGNHDKGGTNWGNHDKGGTNWGNHDRDKGENDRKCSGTDCNKTTSVPEPSTFILFGSMLIGAIGVKKVITG